MSEKCNAETNDGGVCQFEAKYPDGHCGHHTKHEQPYNHRDGKLTKQRQEQIATAIEQGKSINSAARMAGVTPQTVYNWLDKGEDQDEGIYKECFERIARARGHGEDFYFELALELARENEDHQFIASLMKQRYPDSWGETETGVSSPDIEISVSEATYETWQ
jgi:transposase-like protein